MPVHHIPRLRLHEDLESLRREHEVVVSITPDPDDDSRYVVVTRSCGDELLTRPAS